MSKDSEVGNRVIVTDPAQVLVMSRALNDALKVVGAWEVRGVDSHVCGKSRRVGDCIKAGSGRDHSSSDVS